MWYTASPDRYRAGYYATKYLTKYPKDGYPPWILARKGRMPRYGHSQRFFPRVSGHDPMCFCDECRGDQEPRPKQRPAKNNAKKPSASEVAEAIVRPARVALTIGERVDRCESESSIVKVQLVQLPDGTVVDGRGKYEGKLGLSVREACEYLGIDPSELWQLELDGPTVTELEEYTRSLAAAREAA